MLALTTACGGGSHPRASNVEWRVERVGKATTYRFVGRAMYAKGVDGWYAPRLTLTDALGCKIAVDVPSTQIADERSAGEVVVDYDQPVKAKRPIASAELVVEYGEAKRLDDPTSVTHVSVYRQERVVDANVHPPADLGSSCVAHAVKAERAGRHKATSDPDQADAAAIGRMSREEVVATAINTAGFLCARVSDLYPDSAGQIIAHCVKYRSGRGRATYRIDADGGTVEEVG